MTTPKEREEMWTAIFVTSPFLIGLVAAGVLWWTGRGLLEAGLWGMAVTVSLFWVALASVPVVVAFAYLRWGA